MTDLWRNKETGYITFEVDHDVDNMDYWEPVFAPNRPWVGLTDREITKIGNLDCDSAYVGIWYDFAKAVESKLKEKNT